ncbi:hypothetical protein [Micromonospora purpureochromogenes]|uniref:Uncharacterized protein n=1 Tax=Micromonospora purpureochromogenes TaxID=47872 RepID=A0ABX2RML5_9ACTN|nr:hypothetical protein [Micromonospora purpureochromogenes]NYF57750.1 hypothetical protein [Micromonospora purpureochromogenes]
MGEAELIGHELIEPCAECGAATAGVVTETVNGDRLAWAVSTRCSGCGSATELDGWGEMPAIVRTALAARVGLVRLRADPDASRPLRVRLLGVFRKHGATIGEAASAFAALTGSGILGTPAEMRLLAERLSAAGATVSVVPHASSR